MSLKQQRKLIAICECPKDQVAAVACCPSELTGSRKQTNAHKRMSLEPCTAPWHTHCTKSSRVFPAPLCGSLLLPELENGFKKVSLQLYTHSLVNT